MGKVLVVDDHPVVRLAVRVLLEQGGHLVLEADNGVDALQQVRNQGPDLVLLDIGIPKLDGLALIPRLLEQERPPKVLVLSSQPPQHLAQRCRQLGAGGFLSKEAELDGLADAVKAVLAGYSYFPQLPPAEAGSEQQQLASLSDRELAVLRQLARGATNREIADAMLLSEKTISTYKARLHLKLGTSNLVELLELAKRQGLD
ncbi:response regulator transcription factor [Gallaecimonas kandeliae]|uniref:response regulator transcription factor n=1 Tax=Gallaecimonas kandeliae TaxID=3029055 RepID=UPI002647D5BD|nr:response regulator transcription factor [Gallaecimonas kandeliae]WKE67008.1 response regulator transcription factor [Gallaecimonas kandeliae]